ncbi:peptidoglycan editing factor PgeF [Acetobacteraceae bacterium H6797]|nr:peptidoglycan editing factor PgeF [Acetobacteraceae bacterium H6797]
MTVEFLTDPLLSGVTHGFFTRNGGVSAGRFATLNCSLGGKDATDAVLENRRRAMDAMGFAPGALSGLHQVHGISVVEVTAPIPPDARPQADGLVSRVPGQVLGIVTGDCGPVLFADAEAGVAGACHAGWRGAVDGVMEATIEAMIGLGARREAIAAVLGPCIRQPSYEVGPDMRDAVLARSIADARFFAPGKREDRWQFDLAGYCEARLLAAGVRAAVVDADTLADEARFFSHRRNTLAIAAGAAPGPIGHQLSAIAVPG